MATNISSRGLNIEVKTGPLWLMTQLCRKYPTAEITMPCSQTGERIKKEFEMDIINFLMHSDSISFQNNVDVVDDKIREWCLYYCSIRNFLNLRVGILKVGTNH